PEGRAVRVAQETLDIYAPISNRLGMSKVKNELEELAYRALEPRAYETLRQKVESRRKQTEAVMAELEATLASKLREAQVPVMLLEGRIKRLYSIHLKLRRQRIDLDQVYDLLALRVITESVKDCYATLGIVHQTWSPIPGRIKDFIAMPRPNGYQALHTSVVSEHGMPFEIQIRAEDMHRVAEEGIAAHWKYKEGRVGAERDEQYFKWLRQLLEWQQEVRDPGEFIQSLKIDLYPEEVYLFTPRGEVKALPRGATVIDFAYSIHTDIGHQCIGARVNGKLVPIRHRLKNGDIVEIVTQAGRTPSRDWLAHVVTSRARQKIRHFIHGQEKQRALEIGRRLFDKEARQFGVNPKTLAPDALGKVAQEHGLQRVDDLMAAVGYGKVSARHVLQKAVPPERLREPEQPGRLASMMRRVLRPGEDRITVRGADDLLVFRARCCNPIRGERIVGYITRGKGVSVHTATCRNVLNLMYDPERRIEVEWARGEKTPATYAVSLGVVVEDRKGMLAAVSAKVSGINTNIRSMEATSEQGQGRIDMTVEINDLKHLEKVITAIKGVPGVLDVERVTHKVVAGS
ncbi:MAG: RelA/SpoT family protein, partial [Vicinamibacteraceae bacterium]